MLDKNYDTVNVFSTAQKTAEFCHTSHTALSRYLKSGKLIKNKFYFIKNKI